MSQTTDYYRHSRPEIVNCIPVSSANRVLDLGCGEGAMSRALRESGRAGEIWGVERVCAAATSARAAGIFDRLLEGDLEQLVNQLPRGHFTHVVTGDVLEHLVDPWSVVARLRECLVRDGRLVCSIPNIRNLSFLLALAFRGRFHYRDSGVLDRTHLRFFARADVHELFADAGFAEIEIGPIRPKSALSWRLGHLVLGDLIVKGFLVTARNPAEPTPRKSA